MKTKGLFVDVVAAVVRLFAMCRLCIFVSVITSSIAVRNVFPLCFFALSNRLFVHSKIVLENYH